MKRILSLLALLSIFLSFSVGAVFAKNDSQEIPEIDGIYNDPGHPGVKVRVFVYKERPGQSVAPALVCNLSDTDSTAVDGLTGWKLSQNWIYNLNTASVPSSVGSAYLPTFSANAFTNWSSGTAGKVSFSRGPDTNINKQSYDGKNIIAWGRTSGSALAVTYTRYISGQVVDVDTIMNEKFSWSWTDQTQHQYCALSNTYDAQDILTHELGHWMGLDDEYTAPFTNNTMYGYGAKGEVKKDTLTTGDVSAVTSIYP